MIKKAFILLQWLLVLLFIVLLVYGIRHRVAPPHYEPQTWRSWDGFAAITYPGIARESDTLSPTIERFQEHMEALRAAGYEAVTTRDIADFLKGKRPMPARAVFIMFEGGRKDSFVRGTTILRRTGMMATMFVPTSVCRLWSSFFLKASDVRYAASDRHWDIGSMGNQANTEIPTDSEGRTGHFLSRRMWTGNNLETERDFARRLAADYESSRNWLTKLTRRPVLAYAYPFSDVGEGRGAFETASDLNEREVEKNFDMAFSRLGDVYNEADSNPYALSRFMVPPDWSGRRLVTELERSQPLLTEMKGFGYPCNWRIYGAAKVNKDTLKLGSGTYAWLYGRGAWRDVDVQATLTPCLNGVTALYARYDSVYTYMRVALSDGKVRVQERLREQFHTLAVCDLGAQALSARVKVRLKNNRGWLWVNDKPVMGPFPLGRVRRSGYIGFGAENGPGTISDFSASPLPPTYAKVGAYGDLPPAMRDNLRGIFTPWYRTPGVVQDDRKDDLRQAGADGVEVIPILTDTRSIDRQTMEAVMQQVTAAQQDPTVKALVKRVAIRGINTSLSQALHKTGIQVTQIVKPEQLEEVLSAKKEIALDDLMLESADGVYPARTIPSLLQYFSANRITVCRPAAQSNTPLPDGVSVCVSDGKAEDKQP